MAVEAWEQHKALRDAPSGGAPLGGPTWTYALAGTVGAGLAGAMLGYWQFGATLYDYRNTAMTSCRLGLGPTDPVGMLSFIMTMVVMCGLAAGLLPGLGLSLWARGTMEEPGLLGWLVALAPGYGLILPAAFHAVSAQLTPPGLDGWQRMEATSSLPFMHAPHGSRILDTARWLSELQSASYWLPCILVAATISAALHRLAMRGGWTARTDFNAPVLAGGLTAAAFGVVFGGYAALWLWSNDECAALPTLLLVFLPLGVVEMVVWGVAAGLLTAVVRGIWKGGWMVGLWIVGYLAVAWSPLGISADHSVIIRFLDFGGWQQWYPRGAMTVTIIAGMLYVLVAPVMLRRLDAIADRGLRAG